MVQPDREVAHQAREEWCSGRSWRDNTAVFYPGDQMRCPGPLELSRGGKVPCGADLKETVKPSTRVVVRVRRREDSPHPGTFRTCTRCWSLLEVIAMHENQRLEATG